MLTDLYLLPLLSGQVVDMASPGVQLSFDPMYKVWMWCIELADCFCKKRWRHVKNNTIWPHTKQAMHRDASNTFHFVWTSTQTYALVHPPGAVYSAITDLDVWGQHKRHKRWPLHSLCHLRQAAASSWRYDSFRICVLVALEWHSVSFASCAHSRTLLHYKIATKGHLYSHIHSIIQSTHDDDVSRDPTIVLVWTRTPVVSPGTGIEYVYPATRMNTQARYVTRHVYFSTCISCIRPSPTLCASLLGLSIGGSVFMHAIDLRAGQSITWWRRQWSPTFIAPSVECVLSHRCLVYWHGISVHYKES